MTAPTHMVTHVVVQVRLYVAQTAKPKHELRHFRLFQLAAAAVRNHRPFDITSMVSTLAALDLMIAD